MDLLLTYRIFSCSRPNIRRHFEPPDKPKMTSGIEITEKQVNLLIRRHINSSVGKRLGLELRRYQVVAAISCYQHMVNGENVVLNLPTGTGKTMVANILSLILLEQNPSSRCLYLAPSRSLAYQHRHYSKWLAPKYQSILLIEEAKSLDRLTSLLSRSHIIVSTPELCANMIRSRIISKDVVNSICMISVDEFDDHFVFQYTDSGASARFDSQYQKLYSCIPDNISVQLVSATDPKVLINAGNKDPVVKAFSKLMDEKYAPAVIEVCPRLYAKYIPTARVEHVSVNDTNVFFLAWAISVEMALTFDRIFQETGYLVSRDYVLSRLESILQRTVCRIRLISGSFVPLQGINHKHFSRLRHLLNCHEHLYEDMFSGFEFQMRRTKIFNLQLDDFVITELPRLIDRRPANEFHVNLQSKVEALIAILNSHKGQSGVLFSRKIRLSNAIFKRAVNDGWHAVQVDSQYSDRLRDKRLNEFSDGKHNLLIITRRTGRRGLDAKSAPFRTVIPG